MSKLTQRDENARLMLVQEQGWADLREYPFPAGDREENIFEQVHQTVAQSDEPPPIGFMSYESQVNEKDPLDAKECESLVAAPSPTPTSAFTFTGAEGSQDVPLTDSDLNQEYFEAKSEILTTSSNDDHPPYTDDTFSGIDMPVSSTLRVELPESTLLTPRSCYEPFEPGVPIVSEAEAVRRLRWVAKQAGQDDSFIEFQLDKFAIYCDTSYYPEEMRSLHHLDVKKGTGDLFFDGQLSVGDTAFFVKRITIAALPIQNYGTVQKHTVRDKIWLQSSQTAKHEIYYRLRTPAIEYRRFFEPFLWVADLAKHFVDFLHVMTRNNRNVAILSFRTTFNTWLSKAHKNNPEFVAWRKQFPRNDFRSPIVANISFLHKEAFGVLGDNVIKLHVIWSEIQDYGRYDFVGKLNDENPPTVVTKYIYDCFSHLPFGDRLEAVPLSKETRSLQSRLIRKRNLELPSPIHVTSKTLSTAASQQIKDIKPGDTISTQRDGADSGTNWRRDISHGFNDADRWFALVQGVRTDCQGRRSFDVIWYYRAVDTLCGLMKYPWNNELFLSDHCSCREKYKITEDQVLGVHDVEFGGTSATRAELFCRQTYFHVERKWITRDESHMWCKHVRKTRTNPRYQLGETLLVVLDESTGRSEPCELLQSYLEDDKIIFRFRRLLRRHQVEASNAPPNELLYSDELFDVRKRRIKEPCFVRFFEPGETIPTPYDRDGVGGFFYITHIKVDNRLLPLNKPFPTSLRQGYDPAEGVTKLRGLDLFCGGGNFGRGLEDGGGIEMKWANDYDSKAMHTYMANISSPGAVTPFLGSIDDLQRLAIKGCFSDKVPRVGDVDFISGGSPCPGFSNLTNDKTTTAQRKNQSLVAAFGSFIDLYRPCYGLLENVPGIVQKKANRDQDVFSQLICAIVGLGYQTQFFFLDASSCGSPQRRSRVFLAFAAPGLHLPRRPTPTHAHPPHTRALTLGNLPTGEAMAERAMPDVTPFDFVSASAATADLPPIYDSKPDICVPFPDHRISIGFTKQLRVKVNHIPTQPWGMNFAQSWFGLDRQAPGTGVLTPAERLFFPADSRALVNRTAANSNAYGRQVPSRLLETVVTQPSPSDAKIGRTLHWREGRPMTIMEARRAQGFRDNDVLLGLPRDQFRIVGNSVAREPAVALGIVFREAWAQSLADERRGRPVAIPDTKGSSALQTGGLPTPSDSDTASRTTEDPLSKYSPETENVFCLRHVSDKNLTMNISPNPLSPFSPVSRGVKRECSFIVGIQANKLPRTEKIELSDGTTTRCPSAPGDVVALKALEYEVTM